MMRDIVKRASVVTLMALLGLVAACGSSPSSSVIGSSSVAASGAPDQVPSAAVSAISSSSALVLSSGSASAPIASASASAIVTKDGTKILSDGTHDGLRVLVVEKKGVRCLRFSGINGGDQSCMDVAKPEGAFHEYVRLMTLGFAFNTEAKRGLMIGLGGGSVPRVLEKAMPEVTLDVVELEPLVIEAAKGFFFVNESDHLKIHQGDGRKYVESSQEKWDVVMLDAFGDEYIPFPLATVEFLRGVDARLAPNGVVVSNLWYTNDRLFRAGVKTFLEVFSAVYVFKGRTSGNAIVVATHDDKPISQKELNTRAKSVADRSHFTFDFLDAPRLMTPHTSLPLKDVSAIFDANEDVFNKLVKGK